MRMRKPGRIALWLVALAVSVHGVSAADRLSLDTAAFPAGAAEGSTVLRVPSFGRYSISASGGAGAELVLVDRMAGAVARGSNRLDANLEAGEYRLRLAKRAADAVGIAAVSYADSIALPYPDLPDGAARSGSLADLQTASFWIRVDADDPRLVLEIAGRSLYGARLRRDGAWDSGAEPTVSLIDAEPGKPIALLEFDTDLEAGTYLLICEGGARREWADGSKAEPFWISRGARRLGAMGSLTAKLDGKGMASYIVPGGVSRIDMQVRDARSYSLAIAETGSSKTQAYEQAEISPNASSRRASLNPGSGGDRRWLVLRGAPGAEVELRWMSSMANSWGGGLAGVDYLPEYGEYLVSALADFAGGEAADLSAALIKDSGTSSIRRLDLVESHAPGLGPRSPIRRRVNSVEPQSFFMRVLAKGSYTVLEKDKDISARYSFTPIDADFGSEGSRAVAIESGAAIELLERMYLVEMEPVKKGILDFAIALRSESAAARRSLSTPAPSPSEAFTWASVGIARERGHVLAIGSRSESAIGVETRKLPLDPEEPFFLSLEAGQKLAVPVECERDVALEADGQGLSLFVDGRPAAWGTAIGRGRHKLEISANAASFFIVGARPIRAPARPVEDPYSRYEVFSEGRPLFRDFKKQEHALFLLEVSEPGPYRIETSGRLAMSISIRGSSEPKLFSASMNGSGRNAIVSAYLRPGRYLVDAKAEGSSAGRAGLLLLKPAIHAAGRLAPGAILRSTLAEGALLAASVEIPARGGYAISCLCLGESPSYRFEDEGGWPVDKPLASGVFAGELLAGSYTYISYPSEKSSRRLLRLEAEADTPADTPNLAIGSRRRATWMESPDRSPDQYRLQSPARLNVVLELSEGMEFSLVGPDGGVIAAGRGGEARAVELPRGSSRLDVMSAEVDNLREYSILVRSGDLYEGSSSAIAPGASLPVSVGRGGFVELWSYGGIELEGGLYDESGTRLIALSEAIADDWNFRIVAELSEGRYSLRAWPTGERPDSENRAEGGAVVYMTARGAKKMPARRGDFSEELLLGAEVASLEFTPAISGAHRFDLASSFPAARMTIERGAARVAEGAAPLLASLEANASYTLKAWLPGDADTKAVFSGKRLPEAKLSLADSVLPLEARPSESCVSLALDRGLSALIESSKDLLWSPGLDKGFRPLAEEPIWSASGTVRIATADASPIGAMSARSFALDAGRGQAVELGDMRHSFSVAVPDGHAALLRAAGSTGAFGLCAVPSSSFIPGRIDWDGFAGQGGDPIVGLGPGSHRATLWDSDPDPDKPARRSAASLELFALLRSEKLGSEADLSFVLQPRSALELRTASPGAPMEIALESGMAAFASGGRGFINASGGAATGVIAAASGSAFVVNAGSTAAMCRVRPIAPAAFIPNRPTLDSMGIELLLSSPAELGFELRPGAGSALWIAGSADSARLLADDGCMYEAAPVKTELGPLLELPLKPGRLEISARSGFIKAWMGEAKDRTRLFVGRAASLRGTPLPSGGAALSGAAELYDFKVTESSILAIEAEGPGILALFDESGSCIGSSASETGQALMRSLGPGRYSAFVRPFGSERRSGRLRLSQLEPLKVEGETVTVLTRPGERILFRFDLGTASPIGIGISAQSEELSAALYDEAFSKLVEGTALLRELAAGTYYYIVGAGASTQRIEARFYGLRGSRSETPGEVVDSYREGMEEER